jgi:hypothetical protein
MGRRKKPVINHEQLEAELMTAIKDISKKYNISAGATMIWCPDGMIKILMHKGGDEISEQDARSMMNQFALMALNTANGDNPTGEQFQL